MAWTAVRNVASVTVASEAITPPRPADDMIDPKLAADITDPQLAADNTDAALDAVPTPSTDDTEPIDPIDRKLPTEPMLSTEPRLATDSTESSEAIDHLDAMLLRCHVAPEHTRMLQFTPLSPVARPSRDARGSATTQPSGRGARP